MADIAMLVAEEYERRVKNEKKAASSAAAGGGSGGSGSDERCRFEKVYSVAQGLKHKFDGEMKSQIVSYNWVREPRTQIGVAASHSFFSA